MPFIDAGGHRLEQVWLGPGPENGPTLVLLHEGLGSVAAWRAFPETLQRATGLGVLVYSRWGYGDSEPLHEPREATYMHEEAEETLPDVLAGLGVRQPILVGHSDGGSIALIYAGSERALARGPAPLGIVTLAAHIFVEDCSIESIAGAKIDYETTDLRSRLARYHADVDGAFWGWNRAWLMPAFRAWNIEAYLPRVTCPLLVIQGEDDQYGTLKQVDGIVGGVAGPAARLVLPACQHWPHKEAADTVLTAITRFVADLTAQPVPTGQTV